MVDLENSSFDWVTDQQRVLVGQVSQTCGSHVSCFAIVDIVSEQRNKDSTDQSSLLRPKRASDQATVRPAVRSADLVAGSDDGQMTEGTKNMHTRNMARKHQGSQSNTNPSFQPYSRR